ncbi:MAG: hypothetical protein HQK65_00230 [Desulfamplus sp.]|nr:hypothetical protein [Desulfamplus sp.]
MMMRNIIVYTFILTMFLCFSCSSPYKGNGEIIKCNSQKPHPFDPQGIFIPPEGCKEIRLATRVSTENKTIVYDISGLDDVDSKKEKLIFVVLSTWEESLNLDSDKRLKFKFYTLDINLEVVIKNSANKTIYRKKAPFNGLWNRLKREQAEKCCKITELKFESCQISLKP